MAPHRTVWSKVVKAGTPVEGHVITSQWQLQRASLFRKRWTFFMKLGRMVEGHATRPWCESYTDSSKGVLQQTIKKANLNRHISCPVWPGVMKLCTDVHLISNKFPIRALAPPITFSENHAFMRNVFKKQCAVFGPMQWYNWNLRPFVGLLLSFTVANIYTHMWLNFK